MGSYPKYGTFPFWIIILPWKILFFILLIFGPLFSISASSWFIAWIGLEINMLAILTLLINSSSPREKEATLKYFLIQTLASSILLSAALIAASLQQGLSNHSSLSLLIFLRLLIKIAAAPFHLWLPQVIEGLSWNNTFIILAWQKVAPSALLLNCFETKLNLLTPILLAAFISAIAGATGGLRQSSTRKILSFSSINHLGWALAGLRIRLTYWAIYFLLYWFLLLVVVVLTKTYNIVSLSSSLFPSKISKLAFYLSLLSFGGLPPFIGFIPKWILINQLNSISLIATFLLIIRRLPPLFFYLNLAISSIYNKTKNFLPFQSHSKIPILAVSLNLLLPPSFRLALLW